MLPIHFLLGFERSGTTLLSQLLNAHSKVISPPENLLILQFYDHFKDKKKWREEDLDFLIEHILWEGMKSMHLWGVQPDMLKQALFPLLPDTDYPTIIRTIYSQYMLAKKKGDLKMVVDKNNPFAYHFEKLQAIFPQAKFIFLVRDYRGVFLSRKRKKVFYKSQDPYISGLMWRTINEKIYNELPEKLLVRYEDLVSQPIEVLSKICDFLQIPYEESMLHYQDNLDAMLQQVKEDGTKKMMQFIGSSLFKPIDKSLTDTWKTELSPQEIYTLDTVCQPFAQKMGYKRMELDENVVAKKNLYNLIHFHAIFQPLMKYQFSKIFTTGLLKRFIHK